ncbi:MAG: VOC family protein [Cyanobacteriota bacterium]|nr:VOC family protein [Cyanobacteriota bacterium]
MKVNRINHVAIICSNYEVSKKFYTEVLGFSIIKETFRNSRNSYKLDLKVGEKDQIELFSFSNPPTRVSNPEACGLRHLSFEVDDIEETVRYLELHDIAVEDIRIDEITGKRFTFFQDPDGLPLEIYEI